MTRTKRNRGQRGMEQARGEKNLEKNNADSSTPAKMPSRRQYRQRAHANPFSDHQLTYPNRPSNMDWTHLFPKPARTSQQAETNNHRSSVDDCKPNVADIGCGFGGLLVALSPMLPHDQLIGLEIRAQVARYVQERIAALRQAESTGHLYNNVACLRANAMKFLPNFFSRAQLRKLFFCFPDPHFKARKQKARIISSMLNAEYAYVLRPGGIVYTITDVQDLHEWMVSQFNASPSFERIEEAVQAADICVQTMATETEEAKKVDRNRGQKFIACFRRLEDPAWPTEYQI